MTIKLNRPYKVVRERTRQYERHYSFPAQNALVVPLKIWGDQVSCDVRWEDDFGRLHHQRNRVFAVENLVPLDEMLEYELHELWMHYYAGDTKRTHAIAKPVMEHQEYTSYH